jgi:micrococcal nuclease
LRFIICMSCLLIVACSPSQPVVEQVVDGDTLVLMGDESEKFELAYIDAPEREQPYGKEAKNFLKEKVNSGSVSFIITDDKKVEVIFEGKSLNLVMVEKGYAWALPKISEPSKAVLYSEAQKTAVDNLSGLWGLGHGLMVAPWQWRQQGTEVVNNMTKFNRQRELKEAMNTQRMEYQRRMQQNSKAQREAKLTNKELKE